MPTATVSGLLLDSYGRPAVYRSAGSSGVLYRRSDADDRLRPRPANHFADYLSLFTPQRYAELTSECRSIGSRGLAKAILDNKADYIAASGFRPRFVGNDTAWGAEAAAAMADALKICNLRGARFDWRASWKASVPTRATDGRMFVLLTKWPDSGWPALQFLEGHRIGQRSYCSIGETVGEKDALTTITAADGSTSTVRGAYRGLAINNGTITNAYGTEVAYRVLGSTPDKDQDISARDLIQVASPQRYSEGTAIPTLAPGLLDFMALDTAQTCQLDQQIADSKQTFLETNETGKQDPAIELSGMGKAACRDGTPVEMVERGNYRYLKSGTGDLKAFESDRPSDQWMNFDDKVASRAAASAGWRVEMLSPKFLTGGAVTRAFQDQINTLINGEYLDIAPAAVCVLGYFASCLIGLKVIPNSDEWMRWGIARPPWFEVDRASAKIDMEDVAGGRLPISELHERDGHTSIEVFEANAAAYEKAKMVESRHPGVPLDVIRGDWGATAQRTGEFQQATSAPAKPATP